MSEVLTAFIIIGLMTEAVSISETSVNLYETTRRNIPQDNQDVNWAGLPSMAYNGMHL
jgi:hypothetical protein